MDRPTIEQFVSFVYVDDLIMTDHFYRDVLGLQLALDQGSCRIYHVAGAAFLGFCERAGAQPEGIILTLVSEDVDGWYTYLQTQNVHITKAPTLNQTYNIYHLFLQDPQGYTVEIQRFLDPAWPQNLD